MESCIYIYIYHNVYVFLLMRVNLLSAIFASSNSTNGVFAACAHALKIIFPSKISCFVCGRLLSCLSHYSLFRLLSVILT